MTRDENFVYAEAIKQLSELLGDRLKVSKTERGLHGKSETYFPNYDPDAVAYVRSNDELRNIVRICNRFECPIIGWGAGTSLEGHTAAVRGGLTVNFSLMNKILKLRTEDMIAVVEPGISRRALDLKLKQTGLFFPVDPGADASIGGMAATRASGTTTLKYGSMRENVIGLKVVMADGSIIKTGANSAKSSSGYDLTSLFVGSEGTLGLITELSLRLHPRPREIRAGIVVFEKIENAIKAVIQTVQFNVPMARIEFVDEDTVRAFNNYSDAKMLIAPHLLFEIHGLNENIDENVKEFYEICEEFNGRNFRWASKEEERNQLWRMRHNAFYAVLAMRPKALSIVTDICVPISKLAQAVVETQKDIQESGIMGPILGHVGDGNFHAILLVDPNSKEEKSVALKISDRMAERALELGGTCTGEHGIGIGKLKFMEKEHGAGWYVMGQIKKQLDPKNILNPGKLVLQN